MYMQNSHQPMYFRCLVWSFGHCSTTIKQNTPKPFDSVNHFEQLHQDVFLETCLITPSLLTLDSGTEC